MLSILIPIYNFDVRQLVQDLQKQCMESDIAFELLCYDDLSKPSFRAINSEITALEGVIYKELEQNLGRSRIRNAMGKAARFDYLLFMDCDSALVEPDYIKKYISQLKANTVLYGGRVYQNQAPSESTLSLHWHYGCQREQTTAAERSSAPYHSFMSNNFLIPRALFLRILFDESLLQYGHEDTVFGLELRRQNIPILHLDNPLLHIGLEPADRFLSKTKDAIWNLFQLSERNSLIDTRLLSSFRWLKKMHLRPFFKLFYSLLEKRILTNLHSIQPRMLYFDLYKLAVLVNVSTNASSEISQKK